MLACALGQSTATAFPPPLWAKAAHISDSRDRELRRCVPHGSLPLAGPLRGRDRERGGDGHCARRSFRERTLHIERLGAALVQHRIRSNRWVLLYPPPCPSPARPPQGGRGI